MSTPTPEVKFSVHKGRTFRAGQFESLRLDYTIEASAPPETVHQAISHWESKLDERLNWQANALAPPKPASESKPPAPQLNSADPYALLPWKQSQKNPNLSTIHVDDTIPEQARNLYNALTKAAANTLKVANNTVTYKLSRTDTAEFLQRWAKPTA